MGLRKFADYKEDPLGKKLIWDVVRAFETKDWEKVRDEYKNVINISKWEEIWYNGKIK